MVDPASLKQAMEQFSTESSATVELDEPSLEEYRSMLQKLQEKIDRLETLVTPYLKQESGIFAELLLQIKPILSDKDLPTLIEQVDQISSRLQSARDQETMLVLLNACEPLQTQFAYSFKDRKEQEAIHQIYQELKKNRGLQIASLNPVGLELSESFNMSEDIQLAPVSFSPKEGIAQKGSNLGYINALITAVVSTLILLSLTLFSSDYLSRTNRDFGTKILLFLTGSSTAFTIHLLGKKEVYSVRRQLELSE